MSGKLLASSVTALVVVVFSAWNLQAAPITYTEQATGSGMIGGRSFTNALITLILVGNTSNVTGGSGFFTNTVGAFTVNIAGIGTATFTDSMQVFDNQTFSPPAAGFGDNTVPGSVLDTFSSVFASYNLTTPIGPITGASFIRPDLTFGTTLGGLNISSAGNSTFTASTVPEPNSVLLLGTVGGILALRLRRSRKRHLARTPRSQKRSPRPIIDRFASNEGLVAK